MNASPFKTNSGPFVQVPRPITSNSLMEVKKNLEDVPFEAEFDESAVDSKPAEPEVRAQATRAPGARWFGLGRFFTRRPDRRLQEDMLRAEMQDLRASYAGLLQATNGIKQSLEDRAEEPDSEPLPLSPFPAAEETFEKLKTRQEEASEILTNIRQRLDSSDERERALGTDLESVQGEVEFIKADVGQMSVNVTEVSSSVGKVSASVSEVSKTIFEVATAQASTRSFLGDFNEKVENKFEQAAETAHENFERLENSSDDVLSALRKMEKSSQRTLWIFACLIAVLFVFLVAFSAKLTQLGNAEEEMPAKEIAAAVAEEAVPASLTPVALVPGELIVAEPGDSFFIEDNFEF